MFVLPRRPRGERQGAERIRSADLHVDEAPSSAASRHLLPVRGEKGAGRSLASAPLAPRSGERVAEGRAERIRGADLHVDAAPLIRRFAAPSSRTRGEGRWEISGISAPRPAK